MNQPLPILRRSVPNHDLDCHYFRLPRLELKTRGSTVCPKSKKPDSRFGPLWRVGVRAQGTGHRVQGAGCRVQGLGCRVQIAGCRVQGAGCRLKLAGCRVQGAGCRVQGYNQSLMTDRPVCGPSSWIQLLQEAGPAGPKTVFGPAGFTP